VALTAVVTSAAFGVLGWELGRRTRRRNEAIARDELGPLAGSGYEAAALPDGATALAVFDDRAAEDDRRSTVRTCVRGPDGLAPDVRRRLLSLFGELHPRAGVELAGGYVAVWATKLPFGAVSAPTAALSFDELLAVDRAVKTVLTSSASPS
jgi:hypothetical protein